MQQAREEALDRWRADGGMCFVETVADVASGVWYRKSATRRLRDHDIDLETIEKALKQESWGRFIYAYEVLSILEAVKAEMIDFGFGRPRSYRQTDPDRPTL